MINVVCGMNSLIITGFSRQQGLPQIPSLKLCHGNIIIEIIYIQYLSSNVLQVVTNCEGVASITGSMHGETELKLPYQISIIAWEAGYW